MVSTNKRMFNSLNEHPLFLMMMKNEQMNSSTNTLLTQTDENKTQNQNITISTKTASLNGINNPNTIYSNSNLDEVLTNNCSFNKTNRNYFSNREIVKNTERKRDNQQDENKNEINFRDLLRPARLKSNSLAEIHVFNNKINKISNENESEFDIGTSSNDQASLSITKSSCSVSPLTNNSINTGYLEPVNINDNSCQIDEQDLEEEDTGGTFPFPLPDGTVRLKTDCNSGESLDNSSVSSVSQPHSYINSNADDISDGTNERRFELLADLITREKEYLLFLNILHEEYYLNLVNSEPIDKNKYDKIFKTVNTLLEFNRSSFLPDLEDRLSNWNNTTNTIVCDVFTKNINKIKLYDLYLETYQNSIKQFDMLSQSAQFRSKMQQIDINVAQKYSKILNSMRLDHPVKPSLRSFLIYVNLWPDFVNKFLIAYENFISVDHVEFKFFDEVIRYFNELATKCIDSIEDEKRLEILSSLQRRLGTKFNILDKKRVLLKEGPLVTLSPHLGSIIRVYIVLLNDLLIICDQAENEYEQLKPKRPLDVIGMSVSNDVNAYTNDQIRIKLPIKKDNLVNPENGIAINVPCIQKVFRFYARNLQEKNKWFSVFRTVAQANKYETQIDRSKIGLVPPKFIPEKLSQYCFKCKSEFNLMNRKHHCKACGYIFCRVCSKAQASLEYDSSKRSRVCDFCYDHLYHTFRAMPPSRDQLNKHLTS